MCALGNGNVDTADIAIPESAIHGEISVESSLSQTLNSSQDDGDILPGVTTISDHPKTNSRLEPYYAQVTKSTHDYPRNLTSVGLSRRDVFQRSVILLFGGAVVGEAVLQGTDNPKSTKLSTGTTPTIKKKIDSPSGTMTNKQVVGIETSISKRIAPVNFTRVIAETSINVTLDCDLGCVSVDSKNFTKIQTKKVPKWYPAFLIPPPKVIKEISNGELLVAATIAGAATEMVRTTLLYPLQTVKTRIQTDVHNFTARPPRIQERLVNLGRNVRRHVQEGDLYAGITPSLLISVPATGVYFGIRDVCKRTLGMMPFLNDVEIILIAALVADIVSLCFRTPADTLALRLQDQNNDVGDWVGDSLKRLPSVIITDIPYLLSKIFLGRQFIHGSLSIDKYAEYAILSAVVAAFLTTPFDVARTRILVDSDGDFSSGKDGGSGEGVIKTMVAITNEGRGGIANLFAGWLERVLYLGIGRAWLEPLQIIAYIGIRDTILLRWF